MAARGPLPTGTAIRRNKPTIPTTNLPVSGRSEVPDPPATYELGPAGLDWWGWAWRTPQACAWDDGSLFAAARRASLEDDLAAIDSLDRGLDLAELLGMDEDEAACRRLDALIRRLRALAGNRLAVVRSATDLDDRLGLTPKGLAALRWKIVADDQVTGATGPKPPASTPPATRRRLTVAS